METRKSLYLKKKGKKTIGTIICYILMIVMALFSAGPFLWLAYTSLREITNVYKFSIDLTNLTLSNYTSVIEYLDYPKYVGNTIAITFWGIALDVVLSSLCAYPLATMNFKGKNVAFGILVAVMIIPAAAGTIINYLTISKLGLLNTFAGVVLPSSAKVFSIILLRQAYLQIPGELRESARIDGAGELRIWMHIMIPGIKATVSTIVIFDFIAGWNSYLWPLIVLQDSEKYPLATALQYLNGSLNYKFSYVAAGTVISTIPVIIVFLAMQKNYIEAVAGAIKG